METVILGTNNSSLSADYIGSNRHAHQRLPLDIRAGVRVERISERQRLTVVPPQPDVQTRRGEKRSKSVDHTLKDSDKHSGWGRGSRAALGSHNMAIGVETLGLIKEVAVVVVPVVVIIIPPAYVGKSTSN